MEEVLNSIPVAYQRSEVSPSHGKILKLPINTYRVFFNMNPSNTEKEENKQKVSSFIGQHLAATD